MQVRVDKQRKVLTLRQSSNDETDKVATNDKKVVEDSR